MINQRPLLSSISDTQHVRKKICLCKQKSVLKLRVCAWRQRDSAAHNKCQNHFHQFISNDLDEGSAMALIVDDHCQRFNYSAAVYALTVQFKAHQQQCSEETTAADAIMDLRTFQGTLGNFSESMLRTDFNMEIT